jgi:two-component system nitrate/nitrite sensor histidine kinase NarX
VGTVSIIYLLFDMIVAPVTRLQGGLERMREKDFGVRLPVDRNDEFGMLASGFNQMADRLQSVYGNLEQMVSVKTQALEQQNHELALLYDSAAFLQQPQPAEAMCRGFLQRISDYFGADGGTVRILDPIQGNMHMLVSQGISERLVETERCLKVGDCLCGDAVEKKVAVMHDLRKLDRGHSWNATRRALPPSPSSMSMPSSSIWVSSMHFRQATVFSPRRRRCWKPWASCSARPSKTSAWKGARASWPYPKNATWWRKACTTASRRA